MTFDEYKAVKEYLHRWIESCNICELNAYRENRAADAEWHHAQSRAAKAALQVLADKITNTGESK